MGDVRAIREPISVQQVVQYLAQAPQYGKVIISFENFAPTHIEIRSSVRLTGGAVPEPGK
jgi:hypothetical protein